MPGCRVAMLSLHSCPLGQLGAREVGGMNVYVRELARGLGRLGYVVDIFTRAHDPRDRLVVNLFENVRLIHLRAGPAEEIDKMAQLPYLVELKQNLADFIEVDGNGYDLIHSHYWISGLVGKYFSEVWRVPQIGAFHTIGVVKNSLPMGIQESEVRLAAEQDIAHACRCLIATTDGEKIRMIREWGIEAEKIRVVPCGINPGLFRPVPQRTAHRALGFAMGDKIILSVGRIEALKGLERLVESFSLLPMSKLKLCIIGGDIHSQTETDQLKALAVGLGVGGRVEFLGAVPQGRLPLYYSAAEITAVTSYYESFCLVILESLACGTPVVSTEVGIAPEILTGVNGCVVAEGTPRALAQAMMGILNTPQDGGEAVRRRRATAAGYNWAAITGRIAAVYEETLLP